MEQKKQAEHALHLQVFGPKSSAEVSAVEAVSGAQRYRATAHEQPLSVDAHVDATSVVTVVVGSISPKRPNIGADIEGGIGGLSDPESWVVTTGAAGPATIFRTGSRHKVERYRLR